MNIQATDVRKTYGDVIALDELSLSIPDGSTFGVLGTNGAGKSTLFKLLIGHDRPDAGTLTVGGMDVVDAGRRIREHVGYLPEHVGFPAALTGREVLAVHATARGLSNDGRIERAIDRVGLSQADADRRVSGYSNGMQRRLGLATVLLPEPSVLVLDEPTAGLDPRGVDGFHRIVERITAETDATVVFCSHVLPEIERLCDRAAVLHEGRVQAAGPVEELAAGTARVVFDGVAAVDELLGSVEEAGDLDGITVGGTADVGPTVTVACGPDAIPQLLTTADDAWFADVRVERPGLRGAFRDAVESADAGSAAGSPAPADSTVDAAGGAS